MRAKWDIFRRVMWFDRRERFDLGSLFDALQPQRRVSSKPRYGSGEFWSEKCQRYIQYESNLELRFIKLLEASRKVAFYFEQPIKIAYRRGQKRLKYTPDFGVYLTTGEFILVEIKDLHDMLDDEVQCKTEGLMEYCSKRGFGMLFTDGLHTFAELKKIRLNRTLEREILAAIAEHPIRRREYLAIKRRCGSTHNELLRVILKHDLYYRSEFFKVRHGGYNPVFRAVFVEGKRYDDLILQSFSDIS